MMAFFRTVVLAFVLSPAAWGQLVSEPPDFSNTFPGTGPTVEGTGCLHVAAGALNPGDVDWIRVTLPAAMSQTVVDLDFADGAGSGALFVEVEDGASGFNNGDNNNALDGRCGLGATTTPLGSPTDAVVSVGATGREAIIDIGITGAGDGGFTGAHSESFAYDLWMHLTPEPCTSNDDCVDGQDCTVDACDVATGVCSNIPDDGLCDDGLLCNGAETCSPDAGCVAGVPPDCGDGLCRESDGACVDCLEAADCDDGDLCNGEETCNASGTCQAGAPLCAPEQSCNPVTGTCSDPGEANLGLDIKPGACPNRIARSARGFVAAALVSVAGFDTGRIDASTITVQRADGSGSSVAAHQGPPGPPSRITDVATPFDGPPCACHTLEGDGAADLLVRFPAGAMIARLKLDGVASGVPVELIVGGSLVDGTSFALSDCVELTGRGVPASEKLDLSFQQIPYSPCGGSGVAAILFTLLGIGTLRFFRSWTR